MKKYTRFIISGFLIHQPLSTVISSADLTKQTILSSLCQIHWCNRLGGYLYI